MWVDHSPYAEHVQQHSLLQRTTSKIQFSKNSKKNGKITAFESWAVILWHWIVLQTPAIRKAYIFLALPFLS